MSAAEQLIHTALQEVGYFGKKVSDAVNDKTANAGKGNYTKYARDLYPALQGQPWCDMYVDWCFVKAFGQVTARQLLCGGFSAYTPTSAQYYKIRGGGARHQSRETRYSLKILSGSVTPALLPG